MTARRSPVHQRRVDRSTRRLLAALIDLYQLLRTPMPRDNLLHATLDTALRYVPGAQRGSLLVAEQDELVYHAVAGYDIDQLRSVRFPLAVVRDSVLRGQRSTQVQDYTTWDAVYLGSESYATLLQYGAIGEIRRSLVTAILVGGEFYGTLVLDNLRSHKPFPPEAEALARLFAEQVGSLIEQALLLERLRQTNTMLIEAEKLATLGRFIASIAHEINNPLTAVLGYADFLTQANLGPSEQELLHQLRIGADRVRTVVRNLQLFSRQQRSGQMFINLNLLVEQTLTLKRSDLMLDQVLIVSECAEELPPTWGDAGQIGQVLLNLLVNAHHALLHRPPPRTLTLRTWSASGPEGRRLCFSVADNGLGVPPEIQGRIFEPFFTTKPTGQGTGLGLSISHEIIQSHGGRISVTSDLGVGSVFAVELPVRAPAQIHDLEQPPVANPPERRRILLIDDDPQVLAVVRQALQQGNELTVAYHGAEALHLVAGHSFDLILCDMRMPEIDGPMFYARLCQIRPDLIGRVLFISGDTSSSVTSTFLAESGRPLLSKPFTPQDLYVAIARL